jgi:multidrug resistance efflux pump
MYLLIKEMVPMQPALRVLLTLFVTISRRLFWAGTQSTIIFSPWTRDARVTADIVTIAPDVSGYVTEVRVRNNQFVQKGRHPVCDRPRITISVALANARGDACCAPRAKANAAKPTSDERNSSQGWSLPSKIWTTRHWQAESAAAQYDEATASRDTAALNLARTEVQASVNGYVTNLTLTQGSYASQGKAVLALIDSDSSPCRCLFRRNQNTPNQIGRAGRGPIDG